MKNDDKADTFRTLKDRFEASGLWVESRTQGEDIHILVGKKDGQGNKVHLVIDGRSAEIRVKDDDTAPIDLIQSIQSMLTLPDGRVIKFSRQVIDNHDAWQDKIDEYGASVVQTGGVGSRVYTRTAFLVSEHGYVDADRFVHVEFNSGGDVMTVSPREGFRIVESHSPTGNAILNDDEDRSCRIILEDKLKNEASFRAERRK